MKKEEIHLYDIQRILFGEAPPIFLLEVFIRTLLVYIALLIAVRILGKRTNGELTVSETAIILMLGAIVAVPMQQPDKGILQGLLVLACVVFFQRGITWLSLKSNRFEKVLLGHGAMLVKDGIVQLDALKSSRITRQELFAVIRNKNVYNLSKVERLYLESCGTFSLYTTDAEKPGLPLFPPDDDRIVGERKQDNKHQACTNCGAVTENAQKQPCPSCGNREWTTAIS